MIDAEALNSMHQDELELQARLFYDDTYAMDQNACSSPQLIVWRGGQESCQRASLRWWQAVGRQLTQYAPSEKQIYDKYSLACEIKNYAIYGWMNCRQIGLNSEATVVFFWNAE